MIRLLMGIDDVYSIAKNAGYKLWENLSKEERSKLYLIDREKDYYEYDVVYNHLYPLLLCFKNIYGSEGGNHNNSEYTINLETLKPTKYSQDKTPIPKDISDRLNGKPFSVSLPGVPCNYVIRKK